MWLACNVLGVVLTVVMCGCDTDPGGIGRTECARLRDHMVELRTGGASSSGAMDAAHEALRSSLGDDFLARCEQSITRSQWDCAMAAAAADQLSKCAEDR